MNDRASITLACILFSGALVACTTVTGSIGPTPGTHQIAGHPYRSMNDCVRRTPIGQFDLKCDVPLIGYRNFSDPTIVPQVGAPGGFHFR
ncbi:hypothetical protein [Ensifer sp. BR816]|uniref:hypothetical protein n=1 Tax=Rhizobium sp. (strain BR816) TaxID=1057002 RepID=UPI0003612333|nr:hypothetical protein [Ensifer sp. BR816]